MAQQAQWDAVKPNARHFTINRAFQPGMQRFPASDACFVFATTQKPPYSLLKLTTARLYAHHQRVVVRLLVVVCQYHSLKVPKMWKCFEFRMHDILVFEPPSTVAPSSLYSPAVNPLFIHHESAMNPPCVRYE
jgi:hypothetical protein